MERDNVRLDQWLDTAVGGIRFGLDRKAVRAELQAHLEDKTADFQRIFPELSLEEAEARALGEMGDPAVIGKDLAKVHRPWLGYLWRASKWTAAALVLVLVAVNVLRNDYFQFAGRPLAGKQVDRCGTGSGSCGRQCVKK